MLSRAYARFIFGAPLVALVALAASAGKSPRTACALSIDDAIRIRKPHVQVLVTYTRDIGTPRSAAISAGAKIDVINANGPAGDQAMSKWLVLNTANAIVGEWKLTVRGDRSTCSGIIYVGAPLVPGGK